MRDTEDKLVAGASRSADWQSAVSPICNRQAAANSERAGTTGQLADCKSAIQQIENLRYGAARNVSAYRFLSEVLLYPEDRDAARLETHAEMAGCAEPELRDAIESMMASPELDDCDTYIGTFEINAKCPLYLGHYQFEEPKSCSGAAISGRNGYMIQLKNLYRHFGFELQARELPDYLPLMLEFLALTATHPARKHRRLLVKQFMLPALPALAAKLREVKNVYSHAAGILERLLNNEIAPSPAAPPAPVDAVRAVSESGEAQPRSADFQSAVSPISNRQDAGQNGDARSTAPLAGCKPAIEQIENLRYEPDLPPAPAQRGAPCGSPSPAQPSCL